jgi:uncharacterized membrane protein YadS
MITFFFVFVSQVVGSVCYLKENGLGAAFWCIVFGMLCRLFSPDRLYQYASERMLNLDFFIKVGIVLLAVDLNTIGASGAKGLVVAWAETSVLLAFVYKVLGVWLFKLEPSVALLCAAGLSICGSSAVIALVGSVGVTERDAVVVAILAVMTIATVPLIPAMPRLGDLFLNGETLGAWVGGSVDSTGAVVASASLSTNKQAVPTALVVKMAQNILV